MRLDLDILARMGGPRDRRAGGLRAITTDSGLRVHLPRPHDLRRAIRLDAAVEHYRDGADVVTRPVGSSATGGDLERVDLDAAADALADALASLPDRPGAGAAYVSLRSLARHDRARLRPELVATLGSVRAGLTKAPKPPKDDTPRRPPLTPTARKRAQRARDRADETASAVYALSLWLDDEDEGPAPGARVPGAEAYSFAAELLEDAAWHWRTYRATTADRGEPWEGYCEGEEIGGPPERPRVVSRRRLFQVARDQLGLRTTRPQDVTTIHIPENKEAAVDHADRLYEELLRRMTIHAYDEHGGAAGLADYLARSTGVVAKEAASTASCDNVVPFAARRHA